MSELEKLVAEASRTMDEQVWRSIQRGIPLSALSMEEMRALRDALGGPPLLPHLAECRCAACSVFVNHRPALAAASPPQET